MISAQRRIRIFGKRFMESEMRRILVKTKYFRVEKKSADFFRRKFPDRDFFASKISIFENLGDENFRPFFFSTKKYFAFTKMLLISLSINRFPKIRILR